MVRINSEAAYALLFRMSRVGNVKTIFRHSSGSARGNSADCTRETFRRSPVDVFAWNLQPILHIEHNNGRRIEHFHGARAGDKAPQEEQA